MTPPVYVDGKVRVRAEKCATCIFHGGNRMDLRPGRVRQMVADCKRDESAIICHKTLDDAAGAICRGFFDAYGTEIPALRLAVHTGVVLEV